MKNTLQIFLGIFIFILFQFFFESKAHLLAKKTKSFFTVSANTIEAETYTLESTYLENAPGEGYVIATEAGEVVWKKIYITSDTEINVPADFADVQLALESLSGVFIMPPATVTIKIADGSYTYSAPIDFYHPDGRQIHIEGNTSDPSLVVLNFTTDGFYVHDSSTIGNINGLTLAGDGVSVQTGIRGFKNSYVTIDEQVIIQDFQNGIIADMHSSISFKGTVIDCSQLGLQSKNLSVITLGTTAIVDNCELGVTANRMSHILVRSTIRNNGVIGIHAGRMSSVVSEGMTTLSGNTTNFSPGEDVIGNKQSYIRSY